MPSVTATIIAIVPLVSYLNKSSRSRSTLVYLDEVPADGETIIGSVVLSYEESEKLRDKLDDLLRVGRNWRDEGIIGGDRTLKATAPQSLEFVLTKTVANESVQLSCTISNTKRNVTSYYSDLESLSQLYDDAKTAYDWLESN